MVGKGEITTPIQKLEYRFEGCIRLREEVKKILRSERRIPFFDLFDRHDRNEDFFILVEALKLSTKNHLFILLPFFLSSRTARMSVNVDHLFLALVSFFLSLVLFDILSSFSLLLVIARLRIHRQNVFLELKRSSGYSDDKKGRTYIHTYTYIL